LSIPKNCTTFKLREEVITAGLTDKQFWGRTWYRIGMGCISCFRAY